MIREIATFLIAILIIATIVDGICYYKASNLPSYFVSRHRWYWIWLTPGGGIMAYLTLRKIKY